MLFVRKQIEQSWGRTGRNLMKEHFRKGWAEFKPTRSPEAARDRKNAFPHFGQKRQGERGIPGVLDERTQRSSSCWNWQWSGFTHSTSDSLHSHGLQPTRLLHSWDFLGKSTGVGFHHLLQGNWKCPSWKCVPQSSVHPQQGWAVKGGNGEKGGAWTFTSASIRTLYTLLEFHIKMTKKNSLTCRTCIMYALKTTKQ